MAAEGGHLDTVKTLVSAGANISTQDKCGVSMQSCTNWCGYHCTTYLLT